MTLADTADDSRYALAYARSALDTALAFGAKPFLSVDLMPRALAVNRTPLRDDCLWSFKNRVSNVRPADPAVFAAALIGALERLRLGSDGEPGRAFTHVELWNEPELPFFWDRSFEDGAGRSTASSRWRSTTLVALDAWRAASPHPEIQALRFGFAGFAAATRRGDRGLRRDDAARGAPLDFVSFHAYADDPGAIVSADPVGAQRARRVDRTAPASSWCSRSGAPISPRTRRIPPTPRRSSAGAARGQRARAGERSGLGRAHRAILWDFYPGDAVTLGLADHAGAPKPLQRAYALLARMIGARARRCCQRRDAGLASGVALRDARRRGQAARRCS